MKRLSQRDREILSLIELEGNLTVAEVQRRLGYREHTVRARLRQLRSSDIIRPSTPFVNVYRLGFSEFSICLTFTSEASKNLNAVVQELVASSRVAICAEHGGEYMYMVSVFARNVDEVLDEIDRINGKFGPSILVRSITVRNQVIYLGRKYLAPGKPTPAPIAMRAGDKTVSLDTLDWEVLCRLAKRGDKSLADLARESSIPETTFKRRKRFLEEQGVIEGYYTPIIGPNFGVTKYKFLVSVRGVHEVVRTKLYEFARVHPQVDMFIECLGEWSYELGLEVFESGEVLKVVSQLHQHVGEGLVDVKMLPLFGYLKFETFPFVATEGSSTLARTA